MKTFSSQEHPKLARTNEDAPKSRDHDFSSRRKAAMRAFTRLHMLVYRWSGGRVWNRLGPGPVLLLTTIGRRTGKRTTMPVCYLADGHRLVLVGSAGGAANDPGWVRNLRAHAHVLIELGSQRREMHAHIVEGAEREQLWQRLLQQSSYWGEMQRASSRQFPVIVLTPIE